MRYIGSKIKLLPEIEQFVLQKTQKQKESDMTFLDMFAGTASVALCMKKHFCVLTNDLMAYSLHLARGQVILNKKPSFGGIGKELGGADVLEYLNHLTPTHPGFITLAYSCADEQLGQSSARSFFTQSNALKIDAIRSKIQQWRVEGRLCAYEESYLIACLLEAVTKISNTTGTYGAFLKYWEKRALKPLQLVHPTLVDNKKPNQATMEKAEQLAPWLPVDICYIDHHL